MTEDIQDWNLEEKISWTRSARTAAERALKSQSSELTRMRWSGIALLVSTSAIGFLVYPSIFTGLGVVLGVVLLLLLLSPYWKFAFSLDANALLRWQDGDRPAPSLKEAEQSLVRYLSDAVDTNEKTFRFLRVLYTGVILVSLCLLSLSAGSLIQLFLAR